MQAIERGNAESGDRMSGEMQNYHIWRTREYARHKSNTYKELCDWAETPVELAEMDRALNKYLDLWEACWSAMRDDEAEEANRV